MPSSAFLVQPDKATSGPNLRSRANTMYNSADELISEAIARYQRGRWGRNAVKIQRWLGHHSPSFTLDTYVHLLDDDLV
jgi:integrase